MLNLIYRVPFLSTNIGIVCILTITNELLMMYQIKQYVPHTF